MSSDDQEIWKAFLRHPAEETFAPVYERTKNLVYTICFQTLRTEEDASDAFQRVYERLLAWVRDPRAEDRETNMLWAVRRFAWLESERLRKKRSRQLRKEFAVDKLPPVSSGDLSAAEIAQKRELRERLEALISILHDRYRIPIMLHYFHGMTHQEIAEMMGKSIHTVSSQIRRGLKKLGPMTKRAGLGKSAVVIGALAGAGQLLSPPQVLSAGAVFARADAFAASVLAGMAAGPSPAVSTIASLVKAKLVIAGLVVVGAALLIVPSIMKSPTFRSKSPTGIQETVLSEDSQKTTVSQDHAEPDSVSDLSEEQLSEDEAYRGDKPSGMESVSIASGTFLWYGRVTSVATGKPIKGAWVNHLSTDEFLRPSFSENGERTVLTNSNGEYRLSADPKPRSNLMQAQLVKVEAEGYESRVAVFQDHLLKKGRDYRIDFALGKGGRISGHVVNSKEKPVAGALVGFTLLEQPQTQGENAAVSQMPGAFSRTDEAGAFVLTGLPAGKSIHVPVRAKGYLPFISDELRAGTDDVRLVLEESQARLRGRVAEFDDRPVPDVFVIMIPEKIIERTDWLETFALSHMALTDQKGSFVFGDVVAETHKIMAVSGIFGEDENVRQVEDTVSFSHGDDREIVLRFGAAATLTGRFMDNESGEGVLGVRVSAQRYEKWDSDGKITPVEVQNREEIVTGPDGRFMVKVRPQIGNRPSFYYKLPAGWILVKTETNSIEGHYTYYDLAPGQTAEVEIRLQKGVLLRVRVLHGDGQTPAAEVSVIITRLSDHLTRHRITDAEGRFSIAVVPGAAIRLDAQAEHSSVSREIEASESVLAEEVVLILEEMATVAGKVTDSQGEPVSGIPITVSQALSNRRGYATTQQIATKEDGSYRIERVPPGKVQIQPKPPQESEYVAPEPFNAALSPGEVLEGVDFELVMGDIIEGVVSNDEGELLQGVTVAWMTQISGRYDHRSTQTDSKGHYQLGGIPIGKSVSRLYTNHPDYESESRENISPYDGPQNFVLHPKGKITLVAIDEQSGVPIPSYSYRLLKKTWSGYDKVQNHQDKRVTNPEGRTSLSGISAGELRVDVVEMDGSGQPTGRRGSTFFVLEPSKKSQEVVVRVGEGRKIAGTVVLGEGGPPVKGASVGFENLRDMWGVRPLEKHPLYDPEGTTTDAVGRFELANVSPGVYTLVVEKENLKSEKPVQVEVPEDRDPEPVTIVLSDGAAVFGVVIDFDGNPIPNLTMFHQIYREWMDRESARRVETDEEGRYRFDGLQPGRHWIAHDTMGGKFPYHHTYVYVEVGEEKELNFDFSGAVKLKGRVFINGKAWDGAMILSLLPATGGVPVRLTHEGQGTYSATVEQGEYYLSVANQWPGAFQSFFLEDMWGGVAEALVVASESGTQEHDFLIQLADTELVIDVPEGEEFRKGQVELAQRVGGVVRHRVYVLGQHGRTQKIANVPIGTYKAAFRSDDGKWNGESDWTAVGLGQENVLVIFLENKEAVRVGGWTPEMMSEDFVVLPYNISEVLKQSGDYEVILDYEKGYHGVAIEWVALIENGSEIARDTHIGWSGTSELGHVYRLRINSVHPGAMYTLSVSMRCDGGTDSTGSVYLIER